ncbi:hypothetical protein [Streptomyces sp. NPDC002156]
MTVTDPQRAEAARVLRGAEHHGAQTAGRRTAPTPSPTTRTDTCSCGCRRSSMPGWCRPNATAISVSHGSVRGLRDASYGCRGRADRGAPAGGWAGA